MGGSFGDLRRSVSLGTPPTSAVLFSFDDEGNTEAVVESGRRCRRSGAEREREGKENVEWVKKRGEKKEAGKG